LIHIKVVVKGEADVPPFTKIFEYDSNSENIFFSGVEIIKNRLSHNLRININETLMVYAALIINDIRARKPISEIQENAVSFLSPERVMIGVPESMRKITFEVIIDNHKKKFLVLDEPIPTTDYILTSK
jgi:urease gamma subunit